MQKLSRTLLPWTASGVGGPPGEVKTPGAGRRRSPPRRAVQGQGPPSKTSATRARGRRGSTARPRAGPLAVFADQSPAGREGGGPTAQGPPAGQAPPGITFCWKALWERRRAPQPYPCHSRAVHRRPRPLRPWGATTGWPCLLVRACGQPLTSKQEPCPRQGAGHGEAVRRELGRAPARAAGAAARPAVGGAAGRAGVDRDRSGPAEAKRAPRLGGQAGPRGGGEAPGRHLRA
jgi:hypothetical protein